MTRLGLLLGVVIAVGLSACETSKSAPLLPVDQVRYDNGGSLGGGGRSGEDTAGSSGASRVVVDSAAAGDNGGSLGGGG
jgi:hypothetical protein